MAEKVKPAIGFVADVVRIYQGKRVSRSAAEFAYFLTLSIFPLLIAAIAILASFDLSLAGLFEDFWAGDLMNAVQNYLQHIGTIPTSQILIIAITIIVTSSSAAFRAIGKIMTEVQGKSRFTGIFGFAASVVFALLLIFTIYFSVLMITSGAWLMERVEEAVGIYGLALFWQRIRFVLLFVVAVVVVHTVYVVTGPKEPKIRRLPGAILATIALVAGSMIFSLFVGASARYPLIYGSLAAFILLMVWGYLCGNILIMGNVVNFVLHGRRGQKTEKSQKTEDALQELEPEAEKEIQ